MNLIVLFCKGIQTYGVADLRPALWMRSKPKFEYSRSAVSKPNPIGFLFLLSGQLESRIDRIGDDFGLTRTKP